MEIGPFGPEGQMCVNWNKKITFANLNKHGTSHSSLRYKIQANSWEQKPMYTPSHKEQIDTS